MLAQETSLQEGNKSILRAVVDSYNEGDIETACSHTHPECTLDGGTFGREGDLLRSNMLYTAFPDQVWTWDGMVAEEEWVAGRYTFKGTFKEPYGGIPPNGKEISFTGVSVYRLQEGQIVEIWEYYDKLSLYQQLGVIPELG